MSDIDSIDARGLSCPQPVMLARQALQKIDKGTVAVLVDSSTALDNVSRLAGNLGWNITVEDQPDGSYRMVLKK